MENSNEIKAIEMYKNDLMKIKNKAESKLQKK